MVFCTFATVYSAYFNITKHKFWIKTMHIHKNTCAYIFSSCIESDIKSHGEVLSMMREQIWKKKVKNIHTKKPFPLYHVVQIFNVLCSDAAAEGDKFIVHAIKIEYIKIQICSIQFSDKCARHCRSTWPPFMYLELIEFIAIS